MTRFSALLIGSALVSLIAGHGFAAEGQTEAAPAAATAPAASTAPAQILPENSSVEGACRETGLKVGYVNTNRIAAESARGKAAGDRLAEKSKSLRKKLDAKQKQLEKQKKEIEAKLPGMTPKERAAKGEEFGRKMEAFQKQVRASEKEVGELQEKLTEEMLRAIQEVAREYAKNNGYSVLVERQAVLFAAEGVEPDDVTGEITALLDKMPAK